jgi:septation ring formation regulator EzrA
MTIDERLEALKERLDTIAQSLEILTGMQHANERRFEESAKRFEENDKRAEENAGQFAQIRQTFEIALDSIKRLERIAVRHEQRLDDLDNR